MPPSHLTDTLDDTSTDPRQREASKSAPKPLMAGSRGGLEQGFLYFFVVAPFLAVLAAIPVAWGWGISWLDVGLFFGFFLVGGVGVTMGFHRYFTHGSFKAKRGLKIAMAVAGSLSIEGKVITWVADHRRHHAYSDKEGDPHSPWRYGETTGALIKGLYFAHTGWMFDREKTNKERFTPDLMRDRDIVRVNSLFPAIMFFSLLGPALIGGLATMSWGGAASAFFWGSLVRIFVLHHVTWSVNSICHTIGERPFVSRDKSSNFWPLAIPSFGESWHNSHHADPTAARHGTLKGQLDVTARTIWIAEKFGWAYDVRWPSAERTAGRLVSPEAGRTRGSSA
ncbi:MAG TPA: acyl-CoA desaturase [Mycobacteriales bacterium]|jgi:stearoyl-CoA desaturase (delta-9 desaturase)|nr:acyl-CoA desaturase [Mycobacteriales bacterium]